MSYQKRALPLLYYVKTRIHLVYSDFQWSSRDSIIYTRYSSWKVACNLAPQCNFLYRFFQCKLLKDTIYIEIMVRKLKGIHTFRKDHSSQSSVCSLWGSHVKPLPSLCRKKEDYIKERQNIANPFLCYQSFSNWPKPSPFSNLCKVTPQRKITTKATPRKIGKNYMPNKMATFPQPRKSRQRPHLPYQFQLHPHLPW